MKIGEVAKAAGVTVDTVRFYERRGVLPAADRKPSGYRVFTESTVERIQLAKSLQELGCTLDEVIDALRSHDLRERALAAGSRPRPDRRQDRRAAPGPAYDPGSAPGLRGRPLPAGSERLTGVGPAPSIMVFNSSP